MRLAFVINAAAGTMRSMSEADVREALARSFEASEHHLEVVEIVSPAEIGDALKSAARDVEGLIVGGGDGTISSSIETALENDLVLGVLPLGTFNLIARALGIPLEFEAAIETLAAARVSAVDIGRCNGRPFMHHITFGLHPEIIKARESEFEATKQLSKVLATAQAWITAVNGPKEVDAILVSDGRKRQIVSPLMIVANNSFEEAAVGAPLPSNPRGGELAVYTSVASGTADLVKLTVAAALGQWQSNRFLEMDTAKTLEVRLAESDTDVSIDGELVSVQGPLHCEIEHRALRVLAPNARL